MRDLRCPEHPGSHVRRARTGGPRGRGIYPECVPADGAPHVLSWEDATSTVPAELTTVQLADDTGMTTLSPSELIVLREAANGYTSAQTAERLGKGIQTVKTQRCRILLKLHAANTPQAVCIATERGLLVVERAGERATPTRSSAPRTRQLVRS
jgi:DNA-binding CsgD family transcriptional regulator